MAKSIKVSLTQQWVLETSVKFEKGFSAFENYLKDHGFDSPGHAFAQMSKSRRIIMGFLENSMIYIHEDACSQTNLRFIIQNLDKAIQRYDQGMVLNLTPSKLDSIKEGWEQIRSFN